MDVRYATMLGAGADEMDPPASCVNVYCTLRSTLEQVQADAFHVGSGSVKAPRTEKPEVALAEAEEAVVAP